MPSEAVSIIGYLQQAGSITLMAVMIWALVWRKVITAGEFEEYKKTAYDQLTDVRKERDDYKDMLRDMTKLARATTQSTEEAVKTAREIKGVH